ncbi:Protein YIP5 [Verticillium dahliae VDG2]|nr:Protein YIP5 [Verticillium dahliae VDG2]
MKPGASPFAAAAPAQRIAHLARTMSSSSSAAGASTATSSTPAPWRSLFLEHINTMAAPEFTLATLHSSSSSSGLVPRARTCIHRGLFASLPANPKNEAPLTPPTFSREVTAHFGNLSPVMRGTFRNPPSGTPVAAGPPAEGEGLGQVVTDLEDEVARANFRVVVVVPDEVDRVDLSDPKRGRRWLYRRVGGGNDDAGGDTVPGAIREGDWEKVEVWP